MKCAEFLQELTSYLDGVLDDRTKAELEDHLAWCHNCYVVCDTTKKTIEIYRDSQLYELPDDLRNRLRSPSWPSARPTRKPAHRKPDQTSSIAVRGSVGRFRTSALQRPYDSRERILQTGRPSLDVLIEPFSSCRNLIIC